MKIEKQCEESRRDATLERIQIIPLTELHPFPDHPFSVRDDDDIMKETLDSVRATPHKDNNKMIVQSITKCGNRKRLPHFAHSY